MCKLKYHTYGEFYDRFVFENDTYKIAFRKDSLSIFEKPDLGTKFIMHDYVDSVCETDLTGVVTNAYPAKVKYRGFDNADTTEAYKKLTDYMNENVSELLRDVNVDSK